MSQSYSTPAQFDFYEALRQVIAGRRVTKLEWDNRDFYLVLDNEILKLHKPDGKLYNLIVSLGDMSGLDWVVLE
jgi:hypothetical protein